MKLSPSNPHQSARRAFTLIEILVAVALMTVIMLGLMAMFYQAQRAVHFGTTQADVLQSGRSTMQWIAAELEQASPSRFHDITNFMAVPVSFSPFTQARPRADTHVNIVEDIFFLTRENDRWIGTGYFVESPIGGVGSLYRWTNAVLVSLVNRDPRKLNDLYIDFRRAIDNFPKGSYRITDRVMHFRLLPYIKTGGDPLWFGNSPDLGYAFLSNRVPAYVDLELGVLELKTYERYRSLTNNTQAALQFLERQVDKVHLFQQHIPVHTGL